MVNSYLWGGCVEWSNLNAFLLWHSAHGAAPHLVYRNVAVARMINNPINTSKGKHTLHLPLGGSSKRASLGISLDKCAHFKLCCLWVRACMIECVKYNSLMEQFKHMVYILLPWLLNICPKHQRKIVWSELKK